MRNFWFLFKLLSIKLSKKTLDGWVEKIVIILSIYNCNKLIKLGKRTENVECRNMPLNRYH
jgi:hypothetical protein